MGYEAVRADIKVRFTTAADHYPYGTRKACLLSVRSHCSGIGSLTSIERGIAGPGLLAHVLASKYAEHTPLYHQSEIYAHQGVEPLSPVGLDVCCRLLSPLDVLRIMALREVLF